MARMFDQDRLPTSGPRLAEALGRALFRAEPVDSDYARCVQVSQLLHDAAHHLDTHGDYARAALVREYAQSVSAAGNAL